MEDKENFEIHKEKAETDDKGIEMEDIDIKLEDDKLTPVELARDKTYKIAFFISLPVYIGYACCFSLQRKLSVVFGLTNGVSGTKLSVIYGIGTSFVYFFNLIFRFLGHNLIFGFLHPRDRIFVSLFSQIIGMFLLTYFSFQKTIQNVFWVFVSYAFVGICVGSYEPNMLNIVNKFGSTRIYVLLAMPCGCSCVTILGFCLMTFGFRYQYFYVIALIGSIISMNLYYFTIYKDSKESENKTENNQMLFLKEFYIDLLRFAEWFPQIGLYCFCFFFNNLLASVFVPGCTLFEYSRRVTYRLIGSITIKNEIFMLLFNCGSFSGNFFSMRTMNRKRIISPFFFNVLGLLGVVINMSLIPELAPLSSFLLMSANGSLSCQSSKLIGKLFHEKYHLTATSTFLFFGDFGSMLGSNFIQPLLPYIISMKSKMY